MSDRLATILIQEGFDSIANEEEAQATVKLYIRGVTTYNEMIEELKYMAIMAM